MWYTIFPVLFGTKAVVENVDMYYINANYYIDNTQAVMEDIEKYDPTYVAVVELRPDLKDALIQKYGEENSIIHDDDVFSYGVFGREEILSHIKHRGNMYPFLEFSLAIGDFYLIHPLPPTSLFGAWFQKEYFAEVREVFDTNTKDNKYILWDFNSSHYSKVFQHYFGDLFYDIIYSWKRSHPLSIPIDYVIGNTDNFAVQTNNLKASDHSPFLIYFKRSSEK